MAQQQKQTAPDTLPADFDFSQGAAKQAAPDTLPADFDFSKNNTDSAHAKAAPETKSGPGVLDRVDHAITSALAPDPKNYQSLLRTNLVEFPDTFGREVYSGAKTILGMPSAIYHAFADEPTQEEKDKYAKFEEENGEKPGAETSGLKRIGLGLARVTGVNDAANALHTWANPKTRPTLDQVLEAAPEALGSGAGAVVGGKLVEVATPKVVNAAKTLPRIVKTSEPGLSRFEPNTSEPLVRTEPPKEGWAGRAGSYTEPTSASQVKEPVEGPQYTEGQTPAGEAKATAPRPGAYVEPTAGIPKVKTAVPTLEGLVGSDYLEPISEREITPADVKSSPGTSMGEPLVPTEAKPAGPFGTALGNVEAEPEEIPEHIQRYVDSLPSVGEDQRSATEFNLDDEPRVKQHVGDLSNANLKSLMKAVGLDSDSYDFSKREALREGGSKHPVERLKAIDDVLSNLSDEQKAGIVNQSRALEAEAKVGGEPDKSQRARAQEAEQILKGLWQKSESTPDYKNLFDEALKAGSMWTPESANPIIAELNKIKNVEVEAKGSIGEGKHSQNDLDLYLKNGELENVSPVLRSLGFDYAYDKPNGKGIVFQNRNGSKTIELWTEEPLKGYGRDTEPISELVPVGRKSPLGSAVA